MEPTYNCNLCVFSGKEPQQLYDHLKTVGHIWLYSAIHGKHNRGYLKRDITVTINTYSGVTVSTVKEGAIELKKHTPEHHNIHQLYKLSATKLVITSNSRSETVNMYGKQPIYSAQTC